MVAVVRWNADEYIEIFVKIIQAKKNNFTPASYVILAGVWFSHAKAMLRFCDVRANSRNNSLLRPRPDV